MLCSISVTGAASAPYAAVLPLIACWALQEFTNYHFEVAPAHLEGALDRFAQFFVAPLFQVRQGEQQRCKKNSAVACEVCWLHTFSVLWCIVEL
jgi:hypothetical protein